MTYNNRHRAVRRFSESHFNTMVPGIVKRAVVAILFVLFSVSIAWMPHARTTRTVRSASVKAPRRIAAATTAVVPSEADSIASMETPDPVHIGVLLLNLGGPEKGDDVEGFLFNLFADPDIIRLPPPLAPLQSLIAYIISKRRAPKSRKAYESIGGGSPILKYSNQQAQLVAQSILRRYHIHVSTYIGMRYWHPFTQQALAQIQQDHIQALVILPLYPQFSISTSGSSLRVLQEEFAKRADLWGDKSPITHTVIPQWYQRKGYIHAMASLIQKELDSFTPQQIQEGWQSALEAAHTQKQQDNQIHNNNNIISTTSHPPCARHVLFSAHGVPQSYIEAGDPYQRQIQDCVAQISALLPQTKDGVQCHLSYQSRVGPVEWLRPYTDEVIPQLGQDLLVKNLVVVPISFVSEHIETLEEIDIEYKELALEHGIIHWRRCPALNTDAAFIDDMADMIVEALHQPAQTVTEACVANNVSEKSELMEKLSIPAIGIGGIGGVDQEQDLGGIDSSSSSSKSSSSSIGSIIQSNPNLFSNWTEPIYARVAMIGLVSILVWEWWTGKPITQIF